MKAGSNKGLQFAAYCIYKKDDRWHHWPGYTMDGATGQVFQTFIYHAGSCGTLWHQELVKWEVQISNCRSEKGNFHL